MRRASLLAALLVMLTVAGCGGGSSPTSGARNWKQSIRHQFRRKQGERFLADSSEHDRGCNRRHLLAHERHEARTFRHRRDQRS